jgi:hypothetical protein
MQNSSQHSFKSKRNLKFHLKKPLIFVWFSISYFSLFGQSAGIQFNSGFGKPIVNFDAPGSTVNYQSAMYNDTRLGIWVGDFNKFSGGILFGAFNVNANYVNPDGLASEFQYSSLLIDIPLRYAFENSFVKSLSIGPCMNILMNSNQTINGNPVYNDQMFKSISWSAGAEITFKGYDNDAFSLSPYFNYKQMLTSLDMQDDNETLNLNSFSLGLRFDIPLP